MLFWIAAALLVQVSPVALVKVGAIVVIAFVYVRLFARNVTVDHAVFVGVAWLLLDIVAEMTLPLDLLGTASATPMRSLLLVTWIGAPAMFARYA